MNKWTGWASKIMIAGLLTGLLLGFLAPEVLGFSSPAKLWTTTRLDSSLEVENLSPGDTVNQRIEIGNNGKEAIGYQLVFIKQGEIWSCDIGGHNLDYQLFWGQGADQYLQPGEVERIEIEVAIPISTQNSCKNKKGMLLIRRGTVEEVVEKGVYDCFISSMFGLSVPGTIGSQLRRGTICYAQGALVDRIINPHRLRGPRYRNF
jgi:hypothetical protein